MTTTIIIFPVIMGLAGLLVKNKVFNRISLFSSSALYIIIASASWFHLELPWLPDWLSVFFQFDNIGLYFFTIMAMVFGGVSVYSLFYFKESGLPAVREASYVLKMLFFLAAMTGVILATHLAMLWVFVEATTLTSALLIYFEKRKSALEATWKYVYICSIGIALAFVGIILLSIGSKNINSLFFADLYNRASEINPLWLKLSFAFIFVGLGTKIGIAPIHAWLPDAHSEAPSPVSALLSGALLNMAFLGLIRVQGILALAHLESFSNFLFMISGFLSLIVSSVFILHIKNYKRMLAYSSIENMGILFIGMSLGSLGMYAAMIHTFAHSLSKTSLFLTSGKILDIYKSKKIDDVSGLLKRDPLTGWLWIISMLSIIGMPPFPVFLSKFLIVKAFWVNGNSWLIIPFFLFMLIVAFGMGKAVFKMSFGDDAAGKSGKINRSFYAYAPQVVLIVILLIIGINFPPQMIDILNRIAEFFH